MSVPPERAPLVSDIEFVSKALAGRNGTLADAKDTVHPDRLSLVNAVPVNRGTLLQHLVVHRDTDGVSRVCLNERAGRLSVDEDH